MDLVCLSLPIPTLKSYNVKRRGNIANNDLLKLFLAVLVMLFLAFWFNFLFLAIVDWL